MEKPFDLHLPSTLKAPVLFSSPHSGRRYPRDFLKASRLDAETLRRSEDSFVDELFADVVGLGVPLLHAHFPRAFLDANREPYELDPRMFSGRLPHFANTRSLRVAGGLGTIARIVADAEEIYRQPLAVEEALARIETYYRPYHRALADTLRGHMREFGIAVLIDCHSMPSSAAGEDHSGRPDIVLGDRYGTSCALEITDHAQQALEKLGYKVRRNKPYAGGYITERYGNPAQNFHALQIEINRSLYMDEKQYRKRQDFAGLQGDLTAFAETMIAAFPGWLTSPRQAAE
jgi:N-formylglutamate deformylase